MQKPKEQDIAAAGGRLSSQNLARQIFNADLPEQFIRTIPAQSLYTVIKRNGIGSSADLVEIATIEQCRLLLDFDCWDRWNFNEENFWAWLALSDENDNLLLLQKLVKFVDLKLITLMLARYVEYEVYEEPTDNPPAPGFYTPDKGSTWISINIEDGTRHLLLGRLLALIFETNAELFYQLLAVSSNTTPAAMEEEAFQDKSKRLAAEGITDQETAAAINSPLARELIKKELNTAEKHAPVMDIRPIEPLIYDTAVLKPLSSLLSEISLKEEIESELTYVLNAAIVHWGVEVHDYEKTMAFIARVKGALNIGLEEAMLMTDRSAVDIYRVLGIQKLYRLGLHSLKELRLEAVSADKQIAESGRGGEEIAVVAELAKKNFPEMPVFLKDGSTGESLRTEPAPIESRDEISKIRETLACCR